MVVKTLHHFAYLYVEVDQTDEDSKIEKYLTKAVNFLISGGVIPQIGWCVNFEGNVYKIYKIEYTAAECRSKTTANGLLRAAS